MNCFRVLGIGASAAVDPNDPTSLPGCAGPKPLIPWLTLRLLSWFFDSLRAQIEDRAVAHVYTEKPFPSIVALGRDPRLSARRRMPNHGGRHIATYVERLVQKRLHGASVRALRPRAIA